MKKMSLLVSWSLVVAQVGMGKGWGMMRNDSNPEQPYDNLRSAVSYGRQESKPDFLSVSLGDSSEPIYMEIAHTSKTSQFPGYATLAEQKIQKSINVLTHLDVVPFHESPSSASIAIEDTEEAFSPVYGLQPMPFPNGTFTADLPSQTQSSKFLQELRGLYGSSFESPECDQTLPYNTLTDIKKGTVASFTYCNTLQTGEPQDIFEPQSPDKKIDALTRIWLRERKENSWFSCSSIKKMAVGMATASTLLVTAGTLFWWFDPFNRFSTTPEDLKASAEKYSALEAIYNQLLALAQEAPRKLQPLLNARQHYLSPRAYGDIESYLTKLSAFDERL